jgi:hypothetical protein
MKKQAAAPAPAAYHPEISALPWGGNWEQCPVKIGYPTRDCLPAGFIWSGAAVPEIGGSVTIYMNSYGAATVNGYFHLDGYLGVICTPNTLPAWFKNQCLSVTLGHFFGVELDPRKPQASTTTATPAAQATQEQSHSFWFTLGPNAGGAGMRSEMLPAPQLLVELTREPLEKCLKRDSSHLLMIWEYYKGAARPAKCLAQFWVGSYPNIKLTDWQKEFTKFAL